jgi:hypothetical protein
MGRTVGVAGSIFFRWSHHEIQRVSMGGVRDETIPFALHDPREMVEKLATAELWPWTVDGEDTPRWTETLLCAQCGGNGLCSSCVGGVFLAPASRAPPDLEALASVLWAGPLNSLIEAMRAFQANVGLERDVPVFREGKLLDGAGVNWRAWRYRTPGEKAERTVEFLRARGVEVDMRVPFVFCYAFKRVNFLR